MATRFDKGTPLIGWSMTKTVNAAIIGRLMLSGRMSFDDQNLLPQWSNDAARTSSSAISSAWRAGLAFNEGYGAVSDVTRMLYLEPDSTRVAADAPQEAAVGERFNYSSGTATLLSRLWMNKLPNESAAIAYPRDALFAPLGMSSAVLKPMSAALMSAAPIFMRRRAIGRASGNSCCGDGVWKGQRLLPEGFVGAMRTPTTRIGGHLYLRFRLGLQGRVARMRNSACRRIRSGCSDMMARASPSYHQPISCWCAWD